MEEAPADEISLLQDSGTEGSDEEIEYIEATVDLDSIAMEMKLEKFLQDHDMPYALLADEWLDTEGMHETLYEMSVNITESEEA